MTYSTLPIAAGLDLLDILEGDSAVDSQECYIETASVSNQSPRNHPMRFGASLLVFVACLFSAGIPQTIAQNATPTVNETREFLRKGDYDRCIEVAQSQVDRKVWNERWPELLLEAQLIRGQYEGAYANWLTAIEQFPVSLRLRLLGVEICRFNNLDAKAREQMELIDELLTRMPARYTGSTELIPLGEYFLLVGEDPKEVLKSCFDQALKINPSLTAAHVATARMAVSKNDSKVAAQATEKALKQDPADPEIFYLDFMAWRSSDPPRATASLAKSLELNTNFVPSILAMVESRMNEEQYEEAEELLKSIEKINARHPKLWSLRAAIAHLEGKYEQEGECRKKALQTWALNPDVDHLIGKHLALHYRFVESITYQKRSLTMDAGYIPAMGQLAQDQLRAGQSDEGWTMVEQVRKKDPYDVTIFNLKQLQQRLDSLETLNAPGLIIRMDIKEAKIYGPEVLALLSEARDVLTKKYEVTLEEPIYVEIFPKQKDFAIRTFGLPGGEGFLGVCFGRLITANSPAALQVKSNWKSVLWHEYCHVVTLNKTKNKMPRWLSEGLSVYEERLRDNRWGQPMDPTYREMILSDTDFIPASQLSSGFLKPKTPMHLQFAYFESSLAVEYLIESHGMTAMLRLLDDLALGIPTKDALLRMVGSLETLDAGFEQYARQKAKDFGPNVDWSKPQADTAIQWETDHPDAYALTLKRTVEAARQKKWDDVIGLAEKLKTAWPEDNRDDGCYALLATAYRETGKLDEERASLVRLTEHASAPFDALVRLVAIDTERQDWESVAKWTEIQHAIQPMRYDVQEARAVSHEQIAAHERSLHSWTACTELDPIDPAMINYKMAFNLSKLGRLDEARTRVLLALEETPRFLDALRLLKEIKSKQLEQSNLKSAETEEQSR
ncbi:MAG: tetratricopeptide repeat protein [Pirellula sp.]